MKTTMLTVLVLTMVGCGQGYDGCPDGAQEVGGRCLRVNVGGATWDEAEAMCGKQGGHLLSVPEVRDAIEREEVAWIGLRLPADATAWEWSDGSPVEPAEWAGPVDATDYDRCIAAGGGDWTVLPCVGPAPPTAPYVCTVPR